MNAKFLRTSYFIGFLAAAIPALSQQSPPDSAKAKQIAALVDKAAALVESKGKSAFPEFRKDGSEWRSDDTYLFVHDMKGIALFSVGFPKLEGTDTSGLKDSNGKLITMELIKMAQSNGSGWVEYMFPKPGQTAPSHKWSYVRAVKVDGTPAYIGAGFYSE